MSQIADYFTGKKILITGASGFIGKVVLEKILRTCPEVSEIYLFLRPKRGKSSQERIDKIFENSLFSIIREENPDQLSKVRLIEADLKKGSLGLKPEDETLVIENCQLIYHVAAAVQFDKGLHEISETNIYGLKLMLEMAKKMSKLEAFIFCSTAFCQFADIALEEKLYDPPISYENLDKILSNFDDDTIRPLQNKLLGLHANTYAFSKAVAESVVDEYSEHFPIAIGRPSIVTNITNDPLPGWVESLNGFNGFVVVAGFGLLKVVPGNQDNPRCAVPADIVSNGLIVIGWQTATNRPKAVSYYNIAEDIVSARQNTYRVMESWGYDASSAYPFEIQVAPFGYHVIENDMLAWLATLWYHVFYGLFLDTLLVLFRKKPMVLSVHRKLQFNFDVIKYYIQNCFVFHSPKFRHLQSVLNDTDSKRFPINVEKALTWDAWMNGYSGFRKYVLKQDPNTIPRSKKLAKALYWISSIFKMTLVYFFIKLVYNHFIKSYF